MTEERMRIVTAEICGWHNLTVGQPYHIGQALLYGTKLPGAPDDIGNPMFGIPDYPNDLNAMHEAILKLDRTIHDKDVCLRDVFSSELEELITKSRSTPEIWSMFDLLNTTARQRCEAFLRTVGKWEEAK